MPESDPLQNLPEFPPELLECLKAIDDRKAEDIRFLDVRGLSSITDYLLIGTGNSDPHVRALVHAARSELKGSGASLIGTEFEPGSGWGVVDAVDFMVHIFKPETRDFYQLESLWKDAREIEVKSLLPQGHS